MRVLLLTADYPPHIWSGIGAAVARQAEAFARSGITVHVLAACENGFSHLPSPEPNLVIHSLNRWRCPVNPDNFDVVHLHSLSLAEMALEMKRRFRRPLVYTVHSYLPQELNQWQTDQAQFWRQVQENVLKEADHLIFLNHHDLEMALTALPEIQGRCTVIPNGISTNLTTRPLKSPEKDMIMFAGRFTLAKGIALLDKIIRRVLARKSYHFVLAGGHGDSDGQQLVDGLAVDFPDNCHLAGWLDRPSLDILLQQAILVLIPSLYEPFGLVALEAMRLGTPVLAAAVIEIMDSATIQARLRQQGPPYVAAYFNEEQWIRRLFTEAYSTQGVLI